MSYVKMKDFEGLYEYITEQAFSEEDGITSLLKVQEYVYNFIKHHTNLDKIIDKIEGLE